MAGELLEVKCTAELEGLCSQRNLTTNYWSLALATIR
jgi:hypothetical protein